MNNEKFFFISLIIFISIYLVLLICYSILNHLMKIKNANELNRKAIIVFESIIASSFPIVSLFGFVFGMFFYFSNIFQKELTNYSSLIFVLYSSFPFIIFSYSRLTYYQLRLKHGIKGVILINNGGARSNGINTNSEALLSFIILYYLVIGISFTYICPLIKIEQCSQLVFLSISILCSIFSILIYYYQTIPKKRKVTFYSLSVINQLLTITSIVSLVILTNTNRNVFGVEILGIIIRVLMIISYILKNPIIKKEFYNQDASNLKLIKEICYQYNISNMKISVINITLGLMFYFVSLIFIK